jgi:hypothetical protein
MSSIVPAWKTRRVTTTGLAKFLANKATTQYSFWRYNKYMTTRPFMDGKSSNLIWLISLIFMSCSTLPPECLEKAEPFRAEVTYSGDVPEETVELLHMVGFELVAVQPEEAQVVVYGRGQFCGDGHREAYYGGCGGIWLCQDVSPAVLAHEFGHAVGARHVEGIAVMAPDDFGVERMTVLDSLAFRNRVLKGSVFDPECRRD